MNHEILNGRYISNLCRHNCGFYGNRFLFTFLAGSPPPPPCMLCQRLSLFLLPPWTAIFPLLLLTIPLLPLSIVRSPHYCGNLFSFSPLAYCLFQPPSIRHALLPRFIEHFLAPPLFSYTHYCCSGMLSRY